MKVRSDDAVCYSTYKMLIENKARDPKLRFQLAQCFDDGFDLGHLIRMLQSEDLDVVNDGIFITSELISIDDNVLEILECLARHQDKQISQHAQIVLSERESR